MIRGPASRCAPTKLLMPSMPGIRDAWTNKSARTQPSKCKLGFCLKSRLLLAIGLIVTVFVPPFCLLMLFLLLCDFISCRTREISLSLSLSLSRWLYHALYLILSLIASGSSFSFGISLSLILPSQTVGHFHQDSRTCPFAFSCSGILYCF